MRSAAIAGWSIIAIFFGGSGAWAVTAPPNGAVVANGFVTNLKALVNDSAGHPATSADVDGRLPITRHDLDPGDVWHPVAVGYDRTFSSVMFLDRPAGSGQITTADALFKRRAETSTLK
jgi:hypothetical protein